MKKRASMILFSILLIVVFMTACDAQTTTTASDNAGQTTATNAAVAVHSGGNCFYRNGDLASHADRELASHPPLWSAGNSPSFGAEIDSCRDVIDLSWSNNGYANGYDFYQVRWSRPGQSTLQFSSSSSSGIDFTNAHFNTIYTFIVQGCDRNWYGSSCTGWSPTVTVATYYPGYCHPGYVWRLANANDLVCVTPRTRMATALDNSEAPYRVDPNGGAYGADTCKNTYVFREAYPGDHVCVTTQTRLQAAIDNNLAYGYTYH